MASQKLEDQVNMRQKNSKRRLRHFKKNKRDTSQWKDSYFVPQPFGDASHCNWFWKNYYSAIEWQQRHQIAYWKSRSVALEYENNILHQHLQMYTFNAGNQQNYVNSTGTRHSRYTHASKINGELEHENCGAFDSDEYQDEKNSDEKFEFQITEEMMDFFEQSIRHKMELQKEREKEKQKEEKLKSDSDDDGAIHPPRKQVGVERKRQMQLMYGKAAPMIVGMETAMQLSFDRNCDLKQPKFWPNIPLKL